MELIFEHSPQVLAREEKATTTTYLGVIYIYISVRNGRGRRFLAWVSMARSVRDLVYHVLADHKTQVTDYITCHLIHFPFVLLRSWHATLGDT